MTLAEDESKDHSHNYDVSDDNGNDISVFVGLKIDKHEIYRTYREYHLISDQINFHLSRRRSPALNKVVDSS